MRTYTWGKDNIHSCVYIYSTSYLPAGLRKLRILVSSSLFFLAYIQTVKHWLSRSYPWMRSLIWFLPGSQTVLMQMVFNTEETQSCAYNHTHILDLPIIVMSVFHKTQCLKQTSVYVFLYRSTCRLCDLVPIACYLNSKVLCFLLIQQRQQI